MRDVRYNRYQPRRRKKPLALKILFGILAVIALLVGVFALYLNNQLNKIQYEQEGDFSIITASYATDKHGNIDLDDEEDDAVWGTMPSDPSRPNDSESPVSDPGIEFTDTEHSTLADEEIEAVASQAVEAAKDETPVLSDSNVINIMLIGTDNRTRGSYTRSDTMILMSINRSKGKLVLTSLMRDSYVHIPGKGNAKLNAATAIGGPGLLLQTVRDTFKIDVQQYIMVDFFALADIIDVLGGVSVSVSAAEVVEINKHVKQFAPGRGTLTGSGTLQLNGPQAVGYARIRRVGNADYQRTERQRILMSAIINKTKSSGIDTLNNLLNTILPKVRTNIDKGSLVSYMTIAPSALNYPISQLRIPAPNTFYGASIAGDVLVLNIAANRMPLNKRYTNGCC